ncbi:collagen alpha-5(VI) chain-like isoform X2 [Biomphalaria glabrata]|uniref:Collagen alpha-5(VI) chain-like isoform X2 n=1 Tax=Biomphalaria glabrata TaxID=6526 RepID=A0A9W2YJ95_BIOGL|nr:collagen alpha-5(VI) chain-like isoform X2 [Biomphalaria glabrata]
MMWLLVFGLALTQVTLASKYFQESLIHVKRNTLADNNNIICDHQAFELGIVLDSSASILPEDFTKGIKFLQDFLKRFDIGIDKVRVAIVVYSNNLHLEKSFNLSAYITKDAVIGAIGNITHASGGYTRTWDGISYMRSSQLGHQWVRPRVPKIGMVITDGNSQEGRKTKSQASIARENGIIMFALGVGDMVGQTELFNIAGDNSRIFRVESYSNLTSIINTLTNKTCVVTCTKPNLTDVYYVFSQSDLGLDKTRWVTDFISLSIVNNYENKGFKYDLRSDQCPNESGFWLDANKREQDFRNNLKSYNVPKLPVVIQHLRSEAGYSEAKGGRRNATKVAIMVVDSNTTAELVLTEVNLLLHQNVTVFVADPTNSGITIRGTTTLKGNVTEQSSQLVYYLLNPCKVLKSM